MNKGRSRADNDKLTPGGELTQLRGVSGSANSSRSLCEYVTSPRCTCTSNGG